ncbi:NADH-quinone oxidoreductase subunit C [Streptomyces venezuelae]|uniref:NADH-quinone oxidoreductase subunit C n=1 Tax=Streptomyces venezuelae TaxID=54571 RepID=UPI0036491D01
MTGWLPSPVEELFGAEATAEESYDVLTVDVPASSWITALNTARTTLACTYFDWLSAVDEPGTGFRVAAHVVALSPVRRLLVRTTVAHDAPVLASAVDVYAGAAWHERETHEMFGVTFEGHPGLTPLLLPETFEGHPLRKDFVLAARVAKAWPGAKEPGESEHGGPKRRQMLPPGVPDPNEWGPLKGQLPAAPARPARGAGRAAAGAGAGTGPRAGAGERPPRRTRSVSQGSASQAPQASQVPSETPSETPSEAQTQPAQPAKTPDAQPTQASQPEAPARPARRTRSASQGSASQQATTPDSTTPATPTTPDPTPPAPKAAPEPKSDAPWHHARPAFEAPEPAQPPAPAPEPTTDPETPRTGETGESGDTADTAGTGDTGNTGGTE